MARSARYDWEVKQGDVHTAFLAPDIDVELYARIPHGFHNSDECEAITDEDERSKGTVRKVLKGLPGLPQGSYLFRNKAHGVITAAGMRNIPDDHAIYFVPGRQIYLAVWVDDFFMFFASGEAGPAANIWKKLQSQLDLSDWKDVDDVLGCQILRDRKNNKIFLSQEKATLALLEKAGMQNSRPVDTPVAAGFVFTKDDCPGPQPETRERAESVTRFRSLLASVIYLCAWTRPDLAFFQSKLSKFMQNPGEKHFEALKRGLRYLKGTAHYGLVYSFAGRPAKTGVYGYYDASFADDIDTRRSTMAYTFFLDGCPISWRSKLHTYVTTSTNHSEYCAAAKAAREAKYFEKVFLSLNFSDAVKPIDLFSDSAGAIAMSMNPVHREASKHIALADHYVREQVASKTITITHVPTSAMIADLLTKPLAKIMFRKHASHLIAKIHD